MFDFVDTVTPWLCLIGGLMIVGVLAAGIIMGYIFRSSNDAADTPNKFDNRGE